MMFVDVSILGNNSIKIRGKGSSFVIDPKPKIPKVVSDAVILLREKEDEEGILRVLDHRVVIKGEGEYEIGGVRIVGTKTSGNFLYSLTIDNMNVFIALTSALSKIQEAGDYNILILNVDSDFKDTMITAFSKNAVILYGEKAPDVLRMFGEKITKSQKFSVSADKLPPETEVVILS